MIVHLLLLACNYNLSECENLFTFVAFNLIRKKNIRCICKNLKWKLIEIGFLHQNGCLDYIFPHEYFKWYRRIFETDQQTHAKRSHTKHLTNKSHLVFEMVKLQSFINRFVFSLQFNHIIINILIHCNILWLTSGK